MARATPKMRNTSQKDSGLKKILLAVSGMSPQIITETLYALHREHNWLPDEIHLITTSDGAQRAKLQLLDEKHLARFLKEYNIKKRVLFCEETIHTIPDAKDKPLADLKTPQDNELAADFITAKVRQFTSRPDTEIHVSLAGGRKTMGFYAGYALSLFGRPQDRLSHVLVSSAYESMQDFFYPTRKTVVIYDRNNNPLDASKAQVWLAEIPFVRMRSGLPKNLLDGNKSFSETIELARRATEAPHLQLFPDQRRYIMNGTEGKLSPVNMALALWVGSHNVDNRAPITPLVEGENGTAYAEKFIETAKNHNIDLHEKTLTLLEKPSGMDNKFIEQTASKLNKAFTKALGEELASLCKLASRSYANKTGYAFPENLTITIR